MATSSTCPAPILARRHQKAAGKRRAVALLLTVSALSLAMHGAAFAAGGMGGGSGGGAGGTGYGGEAGSTGGGADDGAHGGGGGGGAGGGLGGLGGVGATGVNGNTGQGGAGGKGGLNNENGAADGDGMNGADGVSYPSGPAKGGGSGGGGGMGGAGYLFGADDMWLSDDPGVFVIVGGKGGNGGKGGQKGGAGGKGGDGGGGVVMDGLYEVYVDIESVTGGAGGDGGNGAVIGVPGVGALGGTGGAGIERLAKGNVIVDGAIVTGGKGGNGGDGVFAAQQTKGGAGGAGGAGIVSIYTGDISILSGSVIGGNGGTGGNGGSGATAGNGGAGGAGISVSKARVTVETGATITGGDGGAGGTTTTPGAAGAGGVGIFTSGSAVVTVGGKVQGGWSADTTPQQAMAVSLTGGGNELVLTDGFEFDGQVSSDNTGTDTLTLAGDDDSTFDLSLIGDLFTGFDKFTKGGDATWTVTGTTDFDGPTEVVYQTLIVNGSLAKSTMTVGGSGTLEGTGTVGDTTVKTGGTIGGGHGVGTLTVDGDIGFEGGSFYAVDVAPDGTSDMLDVTGSAGLFGTVVVKSASGANAFPLTPSTYTILQTVDGIDGKFDALDTSALAFFDGELDYDTTPRSVLLTLTRNDLGLADVAQNSNQKSAAGAIESLGQGNPLYAGILGLSEEEAQQAYQETSGESLGSADAGRQQTASLMTGAVTDRVDEVLNALDGAEASGYAPVTETGPADPTHSIWISGYGARTSIDASTENAASVTDTAGITFGLDGELGNWTVGVMGGYGQSENNVADLDTTIDSSDYSAGVYAGGKWDSVRAVLGAVYTRSALDSARNITLPDTETLTADYGASTASIFGEASKEFDFGVVSLTPYAGAQYLRLSADGYTETGGDAALAVDARSSDVLYTTVGLRSSADFVVGGDMLLSLGAGAGWRHAFADDAVATHSFVAGGDSFGVSIAEVPADRLAVEASAGLDVSPNLALDLSYTGEFTGSTSTNQLQVGVKGAF